MRKILSFVGVVILYPCLANAEMQLTVIDGSCVTLQIANESASCTPPVIYSTAENGIILIQVSLRDDERVLGFVGDHDQQPAPEHYTLFLKRIRIAKGAVSKPTNVNGTCKMDVSTDGTLVRRIICDATDDAGVKYLMDFRGNDHPVEHKTIP